MNKLVAINSMRHQANQIKERNMSRMNATNKVKSH